MADALLASGRLATGGLAAQAARLRVVSENLANASATSNRPGGDPYARKIANFEAVLDDQSGEFGVQVTGISRDRSPFRTSHDPGHPAADSSGSVKLPNVNPLIELADLREASRSYQANLEVMRRTRELVDMTIDLLRTTP